MNNFCFTRNNYNALISFQTYPDNTQNFYCEYDVQDAVDQDSTNALGWGYVAAGKCMYAMKSDEIVWRCIPEDLSASAISTINSAYTVNSTVTKVPLDINANDGESWPARFMSDVYVLRGYIFGFGFGVSVLVAFLYLMLLRIPGVLFFTIWSMVLSILMLLIIGTVLLRTTKQKWEDEGIKTKAELTLITIFQWIGVGCCVLYTCLVIVLRRRIKLAIGIVKEAAKCLESMPALVFFPIIQCIGLIIFLIPWFFYMLFLASSGKEETKTVSTSGYTSTPTTVQYTEYTYDTNTKGAFVFLVFCWFWTSQFVIAMGQLTTAMSCVGWYFERDKSTIGNGTVLWATRVSMWYHTGTAAFGSLIIAIFKTIRAILTYIQIQLAKSHNKVAEAIICCMQCCLWCMEKCIKFLNKNAYIQCAIHGYSFCKAARTAFFLILRNCLRVVAVNMVADFVLMLSKVMVPAFTTLLCYLSIVYGAERHLPNEINGIISPMVLTFILAYFVSCMFVELFGMCIETILLCYIADEEMFEPAKRFADGDLHESIQDTAAAAAAKNVHAGEDHPQQSMSRGCCGSSGGSEPQESSGETQMVST